MISIRLAVASACLPACLPASTRVADAREELWPLPAKVTSLLYASAS